MTLDMPAVTVAIPTYNRADLLKISLQSALAQDYPNFQVLVLDNASSDHTRKTIDSFTDSRIVYVRHDCNIGLFRNWHQAVARHTGSYLTILQDDDVLLPGFIRQSVMALENHSNSAFSIAQVEGINADGDRVPLPDDPAPQGKMSGLDYLEKMVAGKNWVIHASGVMMRSTVLSKSVTFDTRHSNHTIDLNLYMRLAARYDLVFMPEVLAQVRLHEGQDTQHRFREVKGTCLLATIAERMDAAAHLLQSSRAQQASYRHWLVERLLYMSSHRSTLTAEFVPTLNLSWQERMEVALEEARETLPEKSCLILVDENQWRYAFSRFFQILPFPEKNGEYWGVPADDEACIAELERMRGLEADFVVVTWPAFWWLDYYSGLRDYLNSTFNYILNNSRLIIFEL